MQKDQLITPIQIKMAKVALSWSNIELSEKTGLHRNTINKAQNGTAKTATLTLLKLTFEAAGIEFIPENGGGVGVRLKK